MPGLQLQMGKESYNEREQVALEVHGIHWAQEKKAGRALTKKELQFTIRSLTDPGRVWEWTQKTPRNTVPSTLWPVDPDDADFLANSGIVIRGDYAFDAELDPVAGRYEVTVVDPHDSNRIDTTLFAVVEDPTLRIAESAESIDAKTPDWKDMKNAFGDFSIPVTLQRTVQAPTDDIVLWGVVRRQWDIFNKMNANVEEVLCKADHDALFKDVKAYEELSRLVDEQMTLHLQTTWDVDQILDKLEAEFPNDALLRLYDNPAELDAAIDRLLSRDEEDPGALPYLRHVQDINNMPDPDAKKCMGVIRERLSNPMLIELIWSYWHEECMMVQGMKVIGNRFQNKRTGTDPLINLNINPLRRLGNLMWGYIQDEPNRLSVKRRAYEYDHHYGITLHGRAVRQISPADSRTTFIEAFHRLLYLCSIYFKELDDVTIHADAFPVKNALRDVHVILAEGAHNQYGDLVWVARREMYIEQFILSRPEMREFLIGRPMVPYRESWMQPIDTLKKMMAWTDSSVEHFSTLGNAGEQILLTVRFGNWNSPAITSINAANWAAYWRDAIQDYIHSYRAITGVDLTDARQVDGTQPSVHLLRRLEEQTGVAG